MAAANTAGELTWLLDNLVASDEPRPPGADPVPGRPGRGGVRGSEPGDGEHMPALAAGVQSLARGAGRHFQGGAVGQTIVEMIRRTGQYLSAPARSGDREPAAR